MTSIRLKFRSPAPMRGVTLIELMVALVLGLIVSGAALTLFVTNRTTYAASESLGRIQESQRTAFELMSRDVREGAGNACEKGLNIANVVNTPTSHWYTDFSGGITGYDGGTDFTGGGPLFGTTKAMRVSGTDAIELKSSVGATVNLTQPSANAADMKVNPAPDMQKGDIAMVCNFDHAAIFQISDVNGAGNTNVVHNTGASTSPGNCSKGLGYPTTCTTNGTPYDFGANRPSLLAKLRATRWYIGYNGRTYNGQSSRSLYQSTVKSDGAGNLGVDNNEITQGVSDMQLTYLEQGATAYVDATAITDWKNVLAVKINMSMEGEDKVGTDQDVLHRSLQHIVTLRNRAP